MAIPDSKLAREITKGTETMQGDNPNIRPYIENLWAYLSARADGALGPGRPQKLSTSE